LLSGDFETELLVTTATGFGGAAITYLGFFGFGPPRFINLFCYYLLPTASYNSFNSFFDGLYSSSVAPPFTIILFLIISFPGLCFSSTFFYFNNFACSAFSFFDFSVYSYLSFLSLASSSALCFSSLVFVKLLNVK